MKKYHLLVCLVGCILLGCVQTDVASEEINEVAKTKNAGRMFLSLEEAERLVGLPISCIDIEYPNKLNQVIDSSQDLRAPMDLHPAFYGCFDWHSAVHGHWSLVRLLRTHPELQERETIIAGLQQHLTKENIEREVAYFQDPVNRGYERMYGWAWLLKLSEELLLWDTPEAKELTENLEPLTAIVSSQMIQFLPKLHYPIRVGTHTNTAFGFSLAHDFAVTSKNEELLRAIEKRAKEFFSNDANCPLSWEPNGTDFLSPCFEEANLMRKVLPKEKYTVWLEKFLPTLSDPNFTLEPGIVSDRTDGKLVHLDGLNFSRAWCLFGIAEDFPEAYGHLTTIGNEHIQHSLPSLVGDSYEGGHWLASFALMALSN